MFNLSNSPIIGEISEEWNYLVLEYPETRKAKIFHFTVGAPCFEDFNYGEEAKIWNETYNKSQIGFDGYIKKQNFTIRKK